MIDSCYIGDVRDGLRAMIAAGIRAQTCITSPPYWGLRDYGTAEWEGGEDGCDHLRQPITALAADSPGVRATGLNCGPEYALKTTAVAQAAKAAYSRECGKCGARRIDRQIGLEPTIGEYVQTMVDVFRLVRDVLADDGTLWLNLGDSYATGAGKVGERPGGGKQGDNWQGAMTSPNRMPQDGLKPKDLCGIPWRVAFALQADGWYLRQDIIWAKPNPMPESVTDRCTKAHEYLFLLAKRERYYYDAEAIAEPFADERMGASGVRDGVPEQYRVAASGVNGDQGLAAFRGENRAGRNRRSVWTVTTQPYADAHFATFPPKLIEPCMLAGSRPGDVVLDPFMGSGTVAEVAQNLGRRWIGCELNPDYVAMQKNRAAQLGLSLA